MLDPAAISLNKDGYHLVEGQEWMYEYYYFTNTSYMPKDITSNVGYQDQRITMYANWRPNNYTLHFDANGGEGSLSTKYCYYDTPRNLPLNTFTRTGYQPKPGAEWNTRPDGNGTSYKEYARIKNLTTEHNAHLTFYANWEPVTSSITLDQQGGTGTLSTFYAKYESGFFSNSNCTSALTTISLPAKSGYTFQGYFEKPLGKGRQIINNHGQFQINHSYYVKDAVIYAHYTPNQYTITFDKQGGSYGSDSVMVTYQDYLPAATAPIRNGYTFQGYYTRPNGGGTQYYNANMASSQLCQSNNNFTLYAYWKDDTNPSIQLKSDADGWTNQNITLSATAVDTGTGIKSVHLYQIAKDDSLILMTENKNCNGAAEYTLSFTNPSEGIFRYKAVAFDSSGNSAESYHTVYYDVTPPKGEVKEVKQNGTSLSFQIHITDVNIK